MIYLDNAATSGIKPPGVINAVNLALKKYNANPGRSGYKTAMETAFGIYNIRTKIKDFFGADDSENVVFVPNCTYALNCVIKGVIDGGHIVTSDVEHNAVMRPIKKLLDRGIIRHTAAATYAGDFEKTAQSFESAISRDTRLVVCSHASNVTGQVNPIEKIGQICRNKGIPFAVDAAQSAGILNIDMKRMNIDFLCVAAHKGLYAPMGTGILLARKPLENTIIEGGTGSASKSLIQPQEMPERMESGTVNVPGIFGIGAGVDFVAKKGIDSIYRHEMNLIRYLYKNLSSIGGVILYTPLPENYKYAPVLSFNIEGYKSEQIAEIFAQKNIAVRAGLHCAPSAHIKLGTMNTGAVRVCTGAFNTKNDIDSLVYQIKKL